jgi:arsenate reductase (thioredoxin)
MAKTILFMCPHNAAKSVLAAAYFEQLATSMAYQAASAGTEPAEEVLPAVIELLRREGLGVSQMQPRHVTPQDLELAYRVISLGCPMELLPTDKTEAWDDVPMFSQNPEGSRDAIRAHVEKLVAELREQS